MSVYVSDFKHWNVEIKIFECCFHSIIATGRVSCNFYSAYAATKYGVEAFSDALRREMYPWGIKVSLMEPGGFQTQISEPRKTEKQMRQGWDDLSEELKREYGKDYLEKGMWKRRIQDFF